ncbi:ZIP family metal transporter [Natrinema soli]|uniref:ZIP family metal transporter n=1 Tax=Natrinema soli TaxID=1930624 RepID=A0ABD5SI77_9EURY|nr:ZIP family metal transporter [Natrinema soli]
MDSELAYTIGSVAVVSSLALLGLLFFAVRRDRLEDSLTYFVSFAAGTLFGGTFLHLLPEYADEYGFDTTAGTLLVSGVFLAFALERLFSWHHHHGTHESESTVLPYMILLGDGIHNAVDGMIIATSYLVSVRLGVAATVAIAAHEIPQELSDFAVLVYGGFSRPKALAYNLVTALVAFVGAGVAFAFANAVEWLPRVVIPIAAGNFVYIAGADLIPEFKDEPDPALALRQSVAFLVGLAVLYVHSL